MPQKSLIWCWIPSTKSLIATGGSLDPFKALDKIRESLKNHLQYPYIPCKVKPNLHCLSFAFQSSKRTRNLHAHCCRYTTVVVPDVCSNPRWVSSSKCGPRQLYLNFIVLNLVSSLDQENTNEVKLKLS